MNDVKPSQVPKDRRESLRVKPCIVCASTGNRTMTSHRSCWVVRGKHRYRVEERAVCQSCDCLARRYPVAEGISPTPPVPKRIEEFS